MGRRNNRTILEIDFANNLCEKSFTSLGGDGCVNSDGGGLTIDSRTFRTTKPQGELGWLDSFKNVLYHNQAIDTPLNREIIVEGFVSNKQLYALDEPTPTPYDRRIKDMFADPRPCHGCFGVMEPAKGIFAGFLLTDHALYATYGRHPGNCVAGYINGRPQDCDSCPGECNVSYNCANFWTDCRYIDFKQNTAENEFHIFEKYLAWCNFVKSNNGVDLFNFKLHGQWCARYPFNDAYTRQDFVAWKTLQSYDEYCAFMMGWKEWLRQYREWVKCAPTEDRTEFVGCGGDECVNKLFGDTCCCKLSGNAGKMEEYPYQFGAHRSCCNPPVASFTSMTFLCSLDYCDPLCNTTKVAIGIDRRYKTFRWYVNNQLVWKHVGIGLRTHEAFRIRDLGGYGLSEDICQVLVYFGTGSALDCALPDNYNRYRAKDNDVDMTALLPLMSEKRYCSIYFNRKGELPQVPAGHFASDSPQLSMRLFGQGDIFKIRRLCVQSVPCKRDYMSARNACSSPGSCCGGSGMGGPMDRPNYGVGQFGSCSREDCEQSWCSDDENDCNSCCDPDARSYRIVTNGPDAVLGIPPTAGTPKPVDLRLQRVPKPQRGWDPSGECGSSGFGTNPYAI